MLHCQVGALRGLNSKIFPLDTNEPLHKYCINRTTVTCSKQTGKRLTLQQKLQKDRKRAVHSFRAQVNHVWMPLISMRANRSELEMHSIRDAETLLRWLGRTICCNENTNKYATQIDESSAQIMQYKIERQSIKSPHLKRVGLVALTT